jgi:uncharacterized membrane protein (DUF4010 family)
LHAGFRFAVLALVVLPLLPSGPFGPFGGIRPRELWALVLFFSGISFTGYLARRTVGPGHGDLVTGLIGGIVSSTNVTFTFSRLSRASPAAARALAFGTVAANAVLYPRVLMASAALNPSLVPPLVTYLAPPGIVAALATYFAFRRGERHTSEVEQSDRNPLQLVAALQMAALFQLVLILVQLARQTWGQAGVLASAAVLGLTDVDALTVSMARGVAGPASPDLAARAIGVGILANTALKLGVAMFFGSTRFRAIAGATLAVIMAAGAGALLVF